MRGQHELGLRWDATANCAVCGGAVVHKVSSD
jgi:hypothetical protein